MIFSKGSETQALYFLRKEEQVMMHTIIFLMGLGIGLFLGALIITVIALSYAKNDYQEDQINVSK